MRPSSRAEAAMMVRAVAGFDAAFTRERLSLVESLHYQALWWQSKRFHTLRPGASGRGLDLII